VQKGKTKTQGRKPAGGGGGRCSRKTQREIKREGQIKVVGTRNYLTFTKDTRRERTGRNCRGGGLKDDGRKHSKRGNHDSDSKRFIQGGGTGRKEGTKVCSEEGQNGGGKAEENGVQRSCRDTDPHSKRPAAVAGGGLRRA